MALVLLIIMLMRFFTLQKAIKLYQDKNIWNNLIINAMNTDNSWKKSAQDYIRIFKSLIS